MGQSNAFLIGKIKGILGEEAEEIELPAHMVNLGSSEPPARDLAPARSEGIPDGPEGRHFSFDPKVEIEIHTTNDKTRSEEHTSELQSLMRKSYAVFCLKTKK